MEKKMCLAALVAVASVGCQNHPVETETCPVGARRVLNADGVGSRCVIGGGTKNKVEEPAPASFPAVDVELEPVFPTAELIPNDPAAVTVVGPDSAEPCEGRCGEGTLCRADGLCAGVIASAIVDETGSCDPNLVGTCEGTDSIEGGCNGTCGLGTMCVPSTPAPGVPPYVCTPASPNCEGMCRTSDQVCLVDRHGTRYCGRQGDPVGTNPNGFPECEGIQCLYGLECIDDESIPHEERGCYPSGYLPCNPACGQDQVCDNGTCVLNCNTYEVACNDSCVALCRADQVRNLSTCGCACPSGQEEIDGACEPECIGGKVRNTDGVCACPSGMIDVAGVCEPDPTICTPACTGDFQCVDGQCALVCESNEIAWTDGASAGCRPANCRTNGRNAQGYCLPVRIVVIPQPTTFTNEVEAAGIDGNSQPLSSDLVIVNEINVTFPNGGTPVSMNLRFTAFGDDDGSFANGRANNLLLAGKLRCGLHNGSSAISQQGEVGSDGTVAYDLTAFGNTNIDHVCSYLGDTMSGNDDAMAFKILRGGITNAMAGSEPVSGGEIQYGTNGQGVNLTGQQCLLVHPAPVEPEPCDNGYDSHGVCCQAGDAPLNGECRPISCPNGRATNGNCLNCATGEEVYEGACVPVCDYGRASDGICNPEPPVECSPACVGDEVCVNGICELDCPSGQENVGGVCVDECGTNASRVNGVCGCNTGYEDPDQDGDCTAIPPPPPSSRCNGDMFCAEDVDNDGDVESLFIRADPQFDAPCSAADARVVAFFQPGGSGGFQSGAHASNRAAFGDGYHRVNMTGRPSGCYQFVLVCEYSSSSVSMSNPQSLPNNPGMGDLIWGRNDRIFAASQPEDGVYDWGYYTGGGNWVFTFFLDNQGNVNSRAGANGSVDYACQ